MSTDQPTVPATPTPPAETTTPKSSEGGKWVLTFVFALVLVAAFGVLGWLLTQFADDKATTEVIWARYIYVFGAAEAIAFVAIGWVFGKEVHRAQAEGAQKSADAAAAAKDEAADAKSEAAKEKEAGKQFAASVLALSDSSTADMNAIVGASGGQVGADSVVAARFTPLQKLAGDFLAR